MARIEPNPECPMCGRVIQPEDAITVDNDITIHSECEETWNNIDSIHANDLLDDDEDTFNDEDDEFDE